MIYIYEVCFKINIKFQKKIKNNLLNNIIKLNIKLLFDKYINILLNKYTKINNKGYNYIKIIYTTKNILFRNFLKKLIIL